MSQGLSIHELSSGTLVADRYEIVRPNRQGGLSAAFEVLDRENAEACEMQLFPTGLFEDEGQVEEFSRSWKPWLEVDSPAVVRVRDILHVGSTTLLLITDLPSATVLRGLLKDRPVLGPTLAKRIGRQLLEGLVAIHDQGLVHGDVKPATIHVRGPRQAGEELDVQMVDGGVTPGLWNAKNLGEKTQLIGTPFYAPVEQFGGESPDAQSDVYNVATVLFELATGVLPWPGKNISEVFQAKLERTPPTMKSRAPECELDAGLERVVATGLLADRKERYRDAAAFLEALSAI